LGLLVKCDKTSILLFLKLNLIGCSGQANISLGI
jgi:hypothetical protein